MKSIMKDIYVLLILNFWKLSLEPVTKQV